MRWFKVYDSLLDDPKVQRLPKDVAWNWLNLLCLASQNDGQLPPLSDIAFRLRITDREADSLVTTLLEVGLIDDDGGVMRPHNWDGWQGKTDPTNADRQRRFRERKTSERDVTPDNAVTTVTVTPLEKRREEKIRGEETRASARPLPLKLIFPKDGTIEFTRWADLSRSNCPGKDVDYIASEFRKFCHGRGIEWGDPHIEKTFSSFCRSNAKTRANA